MSSVKLNTQNLIDLFREAKEARATYKSWRFGQSVFNAGLNLFPNQFEGIRATPYDPFYNDSCVPEMVKRLFDSDAVTHFYSDEPTTL